MRPAGARGTPRPRPGVAGQGFHVASVSRDVPGREGGPEGTPYDSRRVPLGQLTEE